MPSKVTVAVALTLHAPSAAIYRYEFHKSLAHNAKSQASPGFCID